MILTNSLITISEHYLNAALVFITNAIWAEFI